MIPDPGGLIFTLCFLVFAASLAASLLVSAWAWLLRQRGDVAAARRAARWSGGLGITAAVSLFAAGLVFSRLSR